MKIIEGNIVDVIGRNIFKGRLFFDKKIKHIQIDPTINAECYIIPGFIDAHVHIESSMLTPLEYSKIAIKHGVIGAVADPHEIANVCGIEGIRYMIENAKLTPMKILFGAPSCVPATNFETSGAKISSEEIEVLFKNDECSHLSEMMNYPGVINNDHEVYKKINIAKSYNKVIDGHAPLLFGDSLNKYVKAGIITDHECSSINEALEKISLGMKILIRNGSATKNFDNLFTLIEAHANDVMLCTDDCHPDDLLNGYINELVKSSIDLGCDIFDVLTAAVKNAKDLYNLPVGLIQIGDNADFLVVNNLKDINIISTFIDGEEVYNCKEGILFESTHAKIINNFYINRISPIDLVVERLSGILNVIEVVDGSLITAKRIVKSDGLKKIIDADLSNDILKIVIVSRYKKAKHVVGFIHGFGLLSGAIACTVAHDSHNIVAVGTNDMDIINAISLIQDKKGGLVAINKGDYEILTLPIAGLMSNRNCADVAKNYNNLTKMVKSLGSTLTAPFMTLSFMSLLVIPELKISDKGLFDSQKFCFINLQI